jgi:hypothetical protein
LRSGRTRNDTRKDAQAIRADAFWTQICDRNRYARTRSDPVVCLGRAARMPSPHFSVRTDAFRREMIVYIGSFEMPLPHACVRTYVRCSCARMNRAAATLLLLPWCLLRCSRDAIAWISRPQQHSAGGPMPLWTATDEYGRRPASGVGVHARARRGLRM